MIDKIVSRLVVFFTRFAMFLTGVLCVLFFIPVLVCQCVLVAWRGVWETWSSFMVDAFDDK